MGKIARAVLLAVAVALGGCSTTSLKETSAPTSRAVAPAPTVATKACPQGYAVVANVWELDKLPTDLRERVERLIAVAEARNTKRATDAEGYRGDDFSRTLGGELRRTVKIRAPWSGTLQVQLRNPTTLEIVGRHDLTVVAGVGRFELAPSQIDLIVETIAPAGFRSPPQSGDARRLWLFPREWGDNCTMNVHVAR